MNKGEHKDKHSFHGHTYCCWIFFFNYMLINCKLKQHLAVVFRQSVCWWHSVNRTFLLVEMRAKVCQAAEVTAVMLLLKMVNSKP